MRIKGRGRNGHAAAWMWALGMLVVGVANSQESESTPGEKPRDIIFILTDDHRYDALGFMGHPFLKTPPLGSPRVGGGAV